MQKVRKSLLRALVFGAVLAALAAGFFVVRKGDERRAQKAQRMAEWRGKMERLERLAMAVAGGCARMRPGEELSGVEKFERALAGVAAGEKMSVAELRTQLADFAAQIRARADAGERERALAAFAERDFSSAAQHALAAGVAWRGLAGDAQMAPGQFAAAAESFGAAAARVAESDAAAWIAAHTKLAGAQLAAGRDAESLATFQQVLARRESLRAPDPRAVDEWSAVGFLQRRAGRLTEAAAAFERAVGLLEKTNDDAGYAGWLGNEWGEVLAALGRRAEAETAFAQALAAVEKSPATAPAFIIPALENLAALQRDNGRLAEAEPLLRRVLALREKSPGPEDPRLIPTLHALAALLRDAGRVAEAEPLARRALAIDEKTAGADSPAVAADLNLLGLILRAAGQRTDAESVLRRALGIAQEAHGADDPSVAQALHSLALLWQDTGRIEEAETALRRAVVIGEKAGVAADTALWRASLARVLQVSWQLPEAEWLYRRNVTLAEERGGAEDAGLVMPLNNLAILLHDTQRLPEALATAERALNIARKTLGDAHPQTRVCAQTLRAITAAFPPGEGPLPQ